MGASTYRIEGAKITPGSKNDEILPKSNPINKDNIIRSQNHLNRIRKRAQDNGNEVWMNDEQRLDFIKKQK